LYVGPVNVKLYGKVPPVDTVTSKDPLLNPHVVPTVVAVTVYLLTEIILVVPVYIHPTEDTA
jgi:hypothetical protein